MKKNSIFLMTASLCFALNVHAEDFSYVLEQGISYELDLQGGGTAEQFSFETYTVDEDAGEAKAVLELYRNGVLASTITEEEWSYYWEVSQCPLTGVNGRTYLLASCISDNDWSTEVLLLQATDDGFETTADLTVLTRQETEDTSAFLSAWARASAVTDAAENHFTVDWFETFRSTGAVTVPVTYTIEDGAVALVNEPCALDEAKDWTAWQPFEVLESTEESAAAVYEVAPGEIVHLTEYAKVNDRAYFKCINQAGEEGWMPDAEEYNSQTAEDGQTLLCGYFEETIYGG